MANQNIGTIQCPLCDKGAYVRETKKYKAYIVCDDCGFQGFARGAFANTRLREKMAPVADLATENHIPMIVVKPKVTRAPAIKKDPAIVRHTAEGENVPGVAIEAPPASALTIFDKDFWKGKTA
jgi:hypothetical protein